MEVLRQDWTCPWTRLGTSHVLRWTLSIKLVLWLFHFPAYILPLLLSDWKGDFPSSFLLKNKSQWRVLIFMTWVKCHFWSNAWVERRQCYGWALSFHFNPWSERWLVVKKFPWGGGSVGQQLYYHLLHILTSWFDLSKTYYKIDSHYATCHAIPLPSYLAMRNSLKYDDIFLCEVLNLIIYIYIPYM